MTSKQRAYLRGLAADTAAVFQIGKSGITPELTQAVDEALEARELIKLSVLKTCPEECAEAGRTIAQRTHSELVVVIGRRIVLYRQSKTKPQIELPR